MDAGLNDSSDNPDGPHGARTPPAHDISSVHIPDHQLVRQIGAGSYGEVWLAKNMLGVFRAVKIVFRDSFQNERPFERELSGLRKFEPVSRTCDGFIDVLHVGSNADQSCFFYVMELGDDQDRGQNIDPDNYHAMTLASEIARRGRLPLHEIAQLGISLSRTLGELHRDDLVHRDIKPSNIIFVNGIPKLADIGLVAKANAALSFVGTAGYIPPEGPGTVQADIYSLGKVLYEASTGNDRQDFPKMPTLWVSSPDHEALLELNEVILRACDNDPRRRYQTASEMQADLAVLAAGKSVRRLRVLEQRLLNIKRAAGMAALMLLFLAIIGLEVYSRWRGAINLHQQQVGGNVAYGNAAMASGDFLGALPYFAEVLRLEGTEPESQPSERLRFGSVLAQCPKLTHLWFGKRALTDGQFSPDGKHVLVAEDYGKCRIYDLESGRSSDPFGPETALSSAAYSPDGRFIVTASQDWTASVWDSATLEEVHRFKHPNRVYSARFSPTGREIVTCCKDGIARVWDLAAPDEPRLFLRGHTAPVNFAAFSPDGRFIATGGQDGTARLWRASGGEPAGSPIHHGRWVMCLCFSPDSQRLVTAADDHRACVWEVPGGRRIFPDLPHRDVVNSAEFSPDGRIILTASLDGTVRLWRADQLRPLESNSILRQRKRVTRACFNFDGHAILTCGVDGSARVWDLAGAASLPKPVGLVFNEDACQGFRVQTNGSFQVCDPVSFQALSPKIRCGALVGRPELAPGGRFVVCISRAEGAAATNSVLRIWDVAGGRPVSMPLILPQPFTAAILSGDGKHLLAYGGKAARLWEVAAVARSTKLLSYEAPIENAVFDARGTRAAILTGNQIYVISTADGTTLFAPLQHARPVKHAEFSPDAQLLVTCCADDQYSECYAQVWKAANGQPVGPQLRHDDGVLWACFSPDGTKVLTAGEDFTARLWETATGKPIGRPMRHEGRVLTARFSPDGDWIVTASADKTARIWWAKTQDPLTPPLEHFSPCMNAIFLPDGKHVRTTDFGGQTRVWDLSIDEQPLEDIVALAYLLGADGVPNTPRSAQSPDLLWRRLRTRYPEEFHMTAQEIAAWHDSQARQSEFEEQWAAAEVHLKCLEKLRPRDQMIRDRLARVRQKLHIPD